MNTIIFSLGSNMGDRLSHLEYAIQEMSRIGIIMQNSSVYESEAWGVNEQQDFLNQVIEVSTKKDAYGCLKIIQEIEKERDRKREKHWGPRTLDIDILFFNQEITNTHQLIIPHPFIEKRLFVLIPLCEILAELQHPIVKKDMLNILDICEDETKVELYKKLTK